MCCIGIPYKRAYALSSYALTCVALSVAALSRRGPGVVLEVLEAPEVLVNGQR